MGVDTRDLDKTNHFDLQINTISNLSGDIPNVNMVGDSRDHDYVRWTISTVLQDFPPSLNYEIQKADEII